MARLLAALLVTMSALAIDAAPLGPETPVVPEVAATRVDPAVAVNAAGVSVVVWRDQAAGVIEARRFAADGRALGPVIAVSARPGNGSDAAPDVAISDSGAFTVAWQREVAVSVPGLSSATQNVIRRFGADGEPLGEAEVLVEAQRFQALGAPVIAGDGRGRQSVVWSRFTITLRNGAVILPRYYRNDIVRGISEVVIDQFAADGSRRGERQTVGTRGTVDRDAAFAVDGVQADFDSTRGFRGYDVAMNASGDAAVTWSDEDYFKVGLYVRPVPTPLGARVVDFHARRYRADGSATGEAETVATLASASRIADERTAPRIALDDAGTMTIGWSDARTIAFPQGTAYVKRIAANGLSLRSAIGSTPGFIPLPPVLAPLDAGRSVAVLTQGGTLELVAQTIGANGRSAGAPLQVSPLPRISGLPAVAAQPDGAHLIVWTAEGGSLMMRRFGRP